MSTPAVSTSEHSHEEHRHDTPGHEHHAHDHGDHGHDHDGHDHDAHDHEHSSGLWARVLHAVRPHSHDHAASTDSALESSAEGIRAVRISLVVLLATSAAQAVVVALSGSVALLADTVHNLSDALTALPLWLAFVLVRRPASRRFTYGLGRVEDLAGLVVVLMIAASALVAAWESLRRLSDPQPVTHLGAVVAAAVIGFLGNEVVASYRIRVGRRIGSAALVADGRHARADGITSLGVLAGALGVALGWPQADPVVGLVITVAIVVILLGAVRDVGRRLLDGVDPAVVDTAEQAVAAVPDVRGVGPVQVRWVGHRLRAEVTVQVDGDLDVAAAHRIAQAAQQAVRAALPQTDQVVVRAEPA